MSTYSVEQGADFHSDPFDDFKNAAKLAFMIGEADPEAGTPQIRETNEAALAERVWHPVDDGDRGWQASRWRTLICGICGEREHGGNCDTSDPE
jgi:hypothetical protein